MASPPTAVASKDAAAAARCCAGSRTARGATPSIIHTAPMRRWRNSVMASDVEYFPVTNRNVPFSAAVRVGNTLYLSGQLGVDASGKLVPGGIVAETRQTLENIKTTLERHGSSLDHIVKALVMLADMSEWGEMNKVYVT